MKFAADLHLHSKYSRAVSQQMVLSKMVQWASFKGIAVVATGDFSHPFWFDRLKNELEDVHNGLYLLKTAGQQRTSDYPPEVEHPVLGEQKVYLLLSCEISSIYNQGGKTRRIHNLFFFPSMSSVEKFNNQLLKRGANLRSDGRPIVGISARDLAEIALSVDQKALVIPAHAWTPWFSVFGAFSGFDSLSECFGDLTDQICAIETGLSSDPAMNWQIEELDNRAILSFSDAHSLEKMGREATVFEAPSISYQSIFDAIKGAKVTKGTNPGMITGSSGSSEPSVTPAKIAFTIEFYPEEGKYHFTGHRDCNIRLSPQETAKKGELCPLCGRQLTIGVMHRVDELKTKNPQSEILTKNGVRWVYPRENHRPPYVSLVPLAEILAEAFNTSVGTKKVTDQYFALVNALGNEYGVLLKASLNELVKLAPPKVVEGIEKVRSGKIIVEPGYDGKFGVVKIWPELPNAETNPESRKQEAQLDLFAP